MGALENTLVIIVADHGELHGDHGFFGHGFAVYQELVHVPLIVSGERFPRGARVPTNVSTRRIFHTVLEAAGLRPPLGEADPNADVARLTLANVANGHPDAEEGVAYTEAYSPKTILSMLRRRNPAIIERLQLQHVRRGVYAGNYKLTTVGEGVEALYNIDRDPTEACDLSAEYPALVAELQGKIKAFVDKADVTAATVACLATSPARWRSTCERLVMWTNASSIVFDNVVSRVEDVFYPGCHCGYRR